MSGSGRRRGRTLALAAVVVAALALAACVPTPATREGREIANLYLIFMGFAAAVAAVVLGLIAWAVLRYRGRTDELPPQVHGHLGLELVWTAIPVAIIVILFALTLLVLGRVNEVDEARTPAADVRATAFRWGWRFEYPAEDVRLEGIGEPGPEIVVPVGEPVRVTLTGEDVVHSFFVPTFLFKRDAIPGRDTVFEFVVEEPGTYRGQCAEFCGIYHARMPFSVRAVDRAAYDAWLAETRGGTAAP